MLESDVSPESITAELAFSRRDDVSVDTIRPGGVLRAKTIDPTSPPAEAVERHACRIHDLAASSATTPSLLREGFETLDLTGIAELASVLERVRRAARIEPGDARVIRRSLLGRRFALARGLRLRILYVAPEGLILRKSGPNGGKADPNERMSEMNGHEAASVVHGDQDVRGTPVRQLLRGVGPWLFRHHAPDGENHRSPIVLVNVWIPLQQITRPLALMDGRSLDRRRHQLRYALPTESFLDRPEDRRMNDIWAVTHDPSQRWYFTSSMDARRAYVFDTLSTPHGAFIAPGEALAERLQRALRVERDAIVRGAASEGSVPVGAPPADTPAPLRRAIAELVGLLDESRRRREELAVMPTDSFWERSRTAIDRLNRQSIELRAVAVVTGFPFRRA